MTNKKHSSLRRLIEGRLATLEDTTNGVTNAFLERDGHEWIACVNTRTGSKEIIASTLQEISDDLDFLTTLAQREGKLSDSETKAIITAARG